MQTRQPRFEPMIYRPQLPEGWYVEEQNDKASNSNISFVKKMKTHHNGQPEKVYVIFCEFAPGTEKWNYTVRGGRKAKPDETMKFFTDLKDATAYLIYVMESTDTWCEEINSEKYIKAYNDRIAKLVAEDEKRKAAFEAAMNEDY